jgi:hypothetical protein
LRRRKAAVENGQSSRFEQVLGYRNDPHARLEPAISVAAAAA